MATKEGSNTQPVAVGERLPEQCSDKLVKAHQLKDRGNDEFKSENFKSAIKKYHHALMYTRGVVKQGDMSLIPGLEVVTRFSQPSKEEKRAANELTLVLSNNLAACFVKTEKWEKALEYSGKVLEEDPDNSKALFRRGTAYMHLNRPEEAQQDLTHAQTLTPENKEIKRKMVLLQKKTRELEIKEQKLYSAMLGQE